VIDINNEDDCRRYHNEQARALSRSMSTTNPYNVQPTFTNMTNTSDDDKYKFCQDRCRVGDKKLADRYVHMASECHLNMNMEFFSSSSF
jgi:hypothetical protein